MSEYVHLRVRSKYNFDSRIKIDQLLNRLVSLGMDSVALTDENSMHHVIEFIELAKEKKKKAIIGLDLSVETKDGLRKILLLAENIKGYKNLIKLSSQAFLNNEKKPNVTVEELRHASKGLIALTGGENGFIYQSLKNKKIDKAEKELKLLKEIYQKNLFIELQDHGLVGQKELNLQLIEIANKNRLDVVATNDVYYFDENEAIKQEVQSAIKEERQVKEIQTDQKYFKTEQEMKEQFSYVPNAIENTVKIANRCQVEIPLKGDKGFSKKIPEFKVDESFPIPEKLELAFKSIKGYHIPDSKKEQRKIAFLCKLAWEGFKKHYKPKDKNYKQGILRLKEELGVIIGKDYIDYFLLIYDIVMYSKKRNIPVSPLRGSAVACLTLRCLDVTRICPMEYDLLFERFLNIERGDEPDIDLDFSSEKRYLIIQYLKEKYGYENVAQILTFGNYGLKSGFLSAGKMLGIKNRVQIAKDISNEAKNMNMIFSSKNGWKIKKSIEKDSRVKTALEYAFYLEGFPNNYSTHAAGIIVSEEPLVNEMPLRQTLDPETEELMLVTQFANDENRLEKAGWSKIDVLGIIALDVWQKVIHMVEKKEKKKIGEIPLNDPETLQMYKDGRVLGVFQMDSKGMREASVLIKPSNVRDIIALISLYRPGPMDEIPRFSDNKKSGNVAIFDMKGNEIPETEDLIPTLEETYGVIVYQEQIMKIANIWAGYSLGEADVLRRAISKKKKETLQKEGIEFIRRSIEKGRNKESSRKLYELIVKFADYGFNKAHGTGYGVFSYEMAWLKNNYPEIFMSVLMNEIIIGKKKETAQCAIYLEETKRMGITVKEPNINRSKSQFVLVEDGIEFGLMMIKNVSKTGLKDLERIREKDGKFVSVFDFIKRTKNTAVDKNTKEALVKIGAFDFFGNRKEVLNAINQFESSKEAAMVIRRDQYTFSNIPKIEADYMPSIEKMPDYDLEELLKFERNLSTVFINNPVEKDRDFIRYLQKQGWKMGVIKNVKKKKDIKDKEMAFATISGPKTEYEWVIFSSYWEKIKFLVKECKVVLFKGEETDRKNRYILTEIKEFPIFEQIMIDIPDEMKQKEKKERDEWIKSLMAILMKHKGETPVSLRFGQEVKWLSPKFSVQVSKKLVEEIRNYTEERESVKVKKFG